MSLCFQQNAKLPVRQHFSLMQFLINTPFQNIFKGTSHFYWYWTIFMICSCLVKIPSFHDKPSCYCFLHYMPNCSLNFILADIEHYTFVVLVVFYIFFSQIIYGIISIYKGDKGCPMLNFKKLLYNSIASRIKDILER